MDQISNLVTIRPKKNKAKGKGNDQGLAGVQLETNAPQQKLIGLVQQNGDTLRSILGLLEETTTSHAICHSTPLVVDKEPPNLCPQKNTAVVTAFTLQADSVQKTSKWLDSNKVRRYVCNLCHKAFLKKKYLRLHKELHAEARPYKCMVCSRNFVQLPALAQHAWIHQGKENPFKCNICNEVFSTRDKIDEHEKEAHTGKNPYVCTVCLKDFSSSGCLLRHSKTHTEGKLYSCEICKKRFALKDYLSRHKRTHTGE